MHTISQFGGLPTIATLPVFGIYVLYSALQYAMFFFIWKNLPPGPAKWALSSALAWVVVEVLPLRIFPWQLSHTQLGFPALVQAADLAGSPAVSFLVLWCSEALWRAALQRQASARLLLPLICLAAALCYGHWRIKQFSAPAGIPQKVALIQGNISLEQKHDQFMFAANVERYAAMTNKIASDNLLVVWPETAIQDAIYDSLGSALKDERLPRFKHKIHLLTGALTVDRLGHVYNSALAIFSDGYIPEPYHKQVLMPFGEYTPLAKTFPWLHNLNPNVFDLTAGKQVKVFAYPAQLTDGEKYEIKVAPLICYEDLIPELSRQAVLKGGELLVNLTNDAWYGNSPAMFNHNLIAAFRSIENRRYLLRSTNTGFTTIINPLGQTIASLKPFKEGTILATVSLIGYKTIYTRYSGGKLWWLLAAVCFVMAATAKLRSLGK